MTMKIKLLLIGEVEVAEGNPLATATTTLDAFREAVHPAAEYGLTLYQATPEDLTSFAGALWMPVVSCARCQEARGIGDCGYCRVCCENRCTHEHRDCFTPEPEA
jgi:hypothetical protein